MGCHSVSDVDIASREGLGGKAGICCCCSDDSRKVSGMAISEDEILFNGNC